MTDGEAMPKRLPRWCVEDVDRHGNIRIYLRRAGRKKVRLEGFPWTEAFMEAYRAAVSAGPDDHAPRDRHVTTPGTWKWLCRRYIASGAFKGLDAVTRKRRTTLLEATWDEPTKPEASTFYSEFPLSRLKANAIRVLRDRRVDDGPWSANNRLKAIRAVYSWATGEENKDEVDQLAPLGDQARDVAYISAPSDGFHTWSIEEVHRFRARHPISTKAYLALALLIYAGGRRSDVVVLGRQHRRTGSLRYRLHKGRNKRPVTIEIPVLPDLAAAIDACPSRGLTFLETELGKPFTSNGFGNWFKDRCVEADLPHCSAHGVRKAGATIAAENGASERQLMAMFGWLTSKMAELYTRAAEQKLLASRGMPLIDLGNEAGPAIVPLSAPRQAGGTIRQKRSIKSITL